MSQYVAESVLTVEYRARLAQREAGLIELKPIKYMVFGSGGHDASSNAPLVLDDKRTSLYKPIVIKPLTSITYDDSSLAVVGTASVSAQEIDVLSEAGLLDEDSRLVAWITFRPKFTSGAESYKLTISVRF